MSLIEERIQKLNDRLVTHLEHFFGEDVEVFQDTVQEDETNLSRIDHVVFETLGFERISAATFSQGVNVYYFSENREDLDVLQVAFMDSLGKTAHTCNKSFKDRMRKKNTEKFVDVLTFELRRTVKNVC
ncbi:hypothetical protein P4J60_20910 [Bacillus cereus]|nr:hypothetical protein [Bacillus cereus]MEB9569677.1 hypothetical protein [Bacillus cereus]